MALGNSLANRTQQKLSFDIYLMYLSAACAPMLAFLAYGTAKWFEGHALSASPYSLK